MKFTLHSTMIYGLLAFAVVARAAPILGAHVDARAVSASLDLSSRGLLSGDGELAVERALLPEDSALEERMVDMAYDEEIYGRADEIYDLSYRSTPLGAIPTPADQQPLAPPHPRHTQNPADNLVKRGIKDFFKKAWNGFKKVVGKVVGVVKNVAGQAMGQASRREVADELVQERSVDLHGIEGLSREGVKLGRSEESLGQ